jgi:hypothetical protein
MEQQISLVTPGITDLACARHLRSAWLARG